MGNFSVRYMDAGRTVSINVNGASLQEALNSAVADLAQSSNWSDAQHRAWVENHGGDTVVETTFRAKT